MTGSLGLCQEMNIFFRAFNIRGVSFDVCVCSVLLRKSTKTFLLTVLLGEYVLLLKSLQGAYCGVQITLAVKVKSVPRPGCDSVDSFINHP